MGGSPERVEFRRMAIVFDDRVDFVARGDGEFGEMLCDFSASSKDCERERHYECVWSKKDKMVMGIYTRWLWINVIVPLHASYVGFDYIIRCVRVEVEVEADGYPITPPTPFPAYFSGHLYT